MVLSDLDNLRIEDFSNYLNQTNEKMYARDAYRCPLARWIHSVLGGGTYEWGVGYSSGEAIVLGKTLPRWATEFMLAFDQKYPQWIDQIPIEEVLRVLEPIKEKYAENVRQEVVEVIQGQDDPGPSV